MKELLLLLLVFFEFFSFSKENVIIKSKECPCINNILAQISLQKYDNSVDYYNNYGFNAQYCRAKNENLKENGRDCCYISLSLDDKMYNFCGDVKLNEESINKIIENISNHKDIIDAKSNDEEKKKIIEESMEKMKKGIKIDCFSKKIKIIKSFIFILLIFII